MNSCPVNAPSIVKNRGIQCRSTDDGDFVDPTLDRETTSQFQGFSWSGRDICSRCGKTLVACHNNIVTPVKWLLGQ